MHNTYHRRRHSQILSADTHTRSRSVWSRVFLDWPADCPAWCLGETLHAECTCELRALPATWQAVLCPHWVCLHSAEQNQTDLRRMRCIPEPWCTVRVGPASLTVQWFEELLGPYWPRLIGRPLMERVQNVQARRKIIVMIVGWCFLK